MFKSALFLFYLAMLSIIGFLATDMYLPAFVVMQQDLATRPATISASLSIFLAGFACSQLFWGLLSDRFGRRPVLLTGLLLFAVGCAGMLWVSNAQMMLVLRFLQAFGVCAATISWQALVVDIYCAAQVKRIFATIMPLVALSPALGPMLGAWLLTHFGWRAIFFVLLLLTLLLIMATLCLKSGSTSRTHGTTTPLLTLLRSPIYTGNVMIYAACSACFFAWLTGSPFILSALGLNAHDIGLSYVPQTLAFLIGGYGCRQALLYKNTDILLRWLMLIFALSVSGLFMVALFAPVSLLTLMIPFCTMALANGALYPIVVASALTPFPNAGGKAASLQNMLQLGLCFLASLAVSWRINTPVITTTGTMLAMMLLAIMGFYLQRRR